MPNDNSDKSILRTCDLRRVYYECLGRDLLGTWTPEGDGGDGEHAWHLRMKLGILPVKRVHPLHTDVVWLCPINMVTKALPDSMDTYPCSSAGADCFAPIDRVLFSLSSKSNA